MVKNKKWQIILWPLIDQALSRGWPHSQEQLSNKNRLDRSFFLKRKNIQSCLGRKVRVERMNLEGVVELGVIKTYCVQFSRNEQNSNLKEIVKIHNSLLDHYLHLGKVNKQYRNSCIDRSKTKQKKPKGKKYLSLLTSIYCKNNTVKYKM